MSKPAASVRLDKLLANLGYGSRREVVAMARAGRIVLDGAVLKALDDKIAPTPDLPTRLRIDGAALDPLPGVVLMLNKPLGMTCSHKDEGPLVYSLLPPRWALRDPPISSVGRLDKDTSGLLLLTDDGDLLHKIIAPKTHMPKRYQVALARPLRGDEAAILASGTLMLTGETKPLLPAALEVHDATQVAVTITEGRYHQVRRMFAALGNHVTELHRDRVGGLSLPADLATGHYRALTAADAAALFTAS
jgi:16S rRNA pseudouridine516 synthase